MKKLFLSLACSTLCVMGVSAQTPSVKDIEKDAETSKNYPALRAKIKSALENEEAKKDAYTWFVAAKIELACFDQMYTQKMIGKPADLTAMGNSLLDGIDYLQKTISLDTVPELDKKTGLPKVDKKTGEPKMKTRFSGKAVSMMTENYTPINVLMSELHNNKEYDNAIRAYELAITLPKQAYLMGKVPFMVDSVAGELRFFQGIAMWQKGNPADAVEAFAKARKLGYLKKEVFDYALNCAAETKNEAAIIAIAEEAMPIYGKQDSQYVRILINAYLNDQKYAQATEILDQAIANDPQNAEFVNLKGNLVENQSSIEEALPYFQKAVELDPTSSKAHFDLGRYYYNKAVKVRDERTDLAGEELAKLTDPLYEQALPYLEKAYELDKDNFDAKNALRAIYYQLGNEEKLNAIEQY